MKLQTFFAVLAALALVGCAPAETPVASHTVTYNGNDATSGSAPASIQVKEGATFVAATNTYGKSGSTWTGWAVYRGSATSPESTVAAGDNVSMGTADVVLSARWTSMPPMVPASSR